MKSKFLLAIIALFCSASLMSQNHSLTFNGSNEYVDLEDGIANHDNFTFEAWVYWNGTTDKDWQRIFDFGHSSNTGYMFLTPCASDDKIRFAITSSDQSNEKTIIGSYIFPVNEWHHIAVTLSSTGNGTLYLDGVSIGTNSAMAMKASHLGSTGNNWLGKSQYSENPLFDGKMDEVRIWSSVRTQSEIRANMYNELAGNESALVAYYKMDETEGESNTTLPCSASNPQDGSLVNMNDDNLETSPAFYGPGNCLEFDGNNDFVDCGTLPASISDITVEMWVKPTVDGAYNQYLFGEWGEPYRAQFTYNMNVGDDYKISFYNPGTTNTLDAGKRITAQTSLNDGKWHHVACVDSADVKYIRIDGVKEASGTANSAVYDGMISHIGGSNQGTNDNFNGQIDEVRIWDHARSQTEIIQNMNRQLTGNEDGLIAYYNFNNDLLGTLQDFSPNANDGTLTNMDASTDWVASEAYNTWLNTSSTDWGTATNWSSGSIPDDSDNVGIYCASNETNPVLGNNLECNHLVISTENTLEIENTVHRTIHGSVFNVFNTRIKDNTELTITGSLYMLHNSSVTLYPSAQLTIGRNLHTRWLGLNGTFTVKSDATGSGSLIVDGSSTGDVDFECYLSGESLAWHTYSAPVNSESIAESSFDPGSGTDNDFYLWNEPAPGTWVNFKNQDGSGGEPNFPTANGGNNNFISGKGYLLAYNEASPIKTIAGDINTDAVNITLENSSAAKDDWTYASGWNLIGNPFSSAIDWSIVDHDAGTSLFQDVYAYAYDQTANGDAGDYVLIDGSQANAFIPAQQGFFVLAKQSLDNQNFSFAKNMKVHANNNVYKSGSTSYDLELLLTGESFSDETWINIHENSSTERDHLDALKLFSFNTASPALYSLSENEVKLAINTLPDISEGSSIHLGFKVPGSENYRISIRQVNTSNITSDIYLEDKYENNVHNLSKSDYNFTSAEGEFADRFVLHFGTTAIDDELQETNPMCAFAAGDAITFINNSDQEGIIKITSVNGMLLYQGNISKQSSKKLSQNFASGIYIGSIETEGFCRSTKLIVSGF